MATQGQAPRGEQAMAAKGKKQANEIELLLLLLLLLLFLLLLLLLLLLILLFLWPEEVVLPLIMAVVLSTAAAQGQRR